MSLKIFSQEKCILNSKIFYTSICLMSFFKTSTQDEKKLSSDNQKLKIEVDALKKFKKRLETVLQNHVAGCNVKDNTSTGYFTNLLQYTNSADEPTEVSSMVSSRSADANPTYHSLNGDTIDTQPPYFDVPSSTTNAIETFTRIGNGCLPSNIETHSERFENTELVNREQTMSLNDLNGMPLRSKSKEQKIFLLKAYLKGNQSKPEVQKLIGLISQMTRTEQCIQNV